MKRKILAAAVAAMASAGAYAQSSVTLYGVADVGVEYVKSSGGDSVARMSSGNMSGSRWGLRGTEDLGGGLKGVFALESGFNVDTGTGGAQLFNRQAFVGLQGNFGTVTLGRHQTPVYDFGLTFDPMSIAGRYSLGTIDSGAVDRADNSIKYIGVFGGLTAEALYSFGYNNNGEIPGDYKAGKEYSLGLSYAAGPFGIGGYYELQQKSDTVKLQRAALGANYAFGPAKAFAGYRWNHLTQMAAQGTRDNVWWLGLGYQVTPALSLTGAAYYQDVARTKADPWLFVVSTDYAMSKRTDVYWNVAYALNRNLSTLSLNTSTDTNGPGVVAGKGQFGTVVGIRHKF